MQQTPTTLEHAEAMLEYLRAVPAGHGHELARAILAASSYYLREVFGQEHAVRVASELVPPVLGLPPVPVPDAVPEAPRQVLH